MELKDVIQKILSASSAIRGGRVVKLKPSLDRFIVYLTSPSFGDADNSDNQYLADQVLHHDPAIDPEVRRQIGLLVPLSPRQYRILRKFARQRRAEKLEQGKMSKLSQTLSGQETNQAVNRTNSEALILS